MTKHTVYFVSEARAAFIECDGVRIAKMGRPLTYTRTSVQPTPPDRFWKSIAPGFTVTGRPQRKGPEGRQALTGDHNPCNVTIAKDGVALAF